MTLPERREALLAHERRELLKLAERVESAPGPDRELDGFIRRGVFGDFGFCGDDEGAWWCSACAVPTVDLTQQPGCGAPLGMKDERTSYPSDWRNDERLPEYTASLDAAMSLVPEGWRFYVDNGTLDDGASHACVYQTMQIAGGSKDAASPALALCAAALKARSQAKVDEG